MNIARNDFHKALDAKSTERPGRPRRKTTRDCPRVTLRLSVEDHERLMAMADGMALSTFIRAKAQGEALHRRKPRSTSSVVDKQALAQILGLLGQSRIANNLNQLAYHANIGSLAVEARTEEEINEAYEHVLFLRQTLLKARGMRA